MDVDVEVANQIAFVTLNRPTALNALSFEMIAELRRVLEEAATRTDVRAVLMRGAGGRAFCAGGDIRALYDSHHAGGTLHRDFFIDEYRLDHYLHRFPKPFVALLDGIVMGGGMGLGQASPLRLVGERTRMAMPEVGIGLVPDVGGSYFLSRLAGSLGAYLALTGTEIRAADAIYTGLADWYFTADAAAAIEPALRAVRWGGDARADIESSLRALASDPGAAPLAPLRAAIDRHFSCATVAQILASLRDETDPQLAPWARATADVLLQRSPTMLAVALRELEAGRRLSLADCFRMELIIVRHCFEQGDILEGVRALIIDKDKRPQWRPARLDEVTAASVDAFFADPFPPGQHPLARLSAD